MRFPITIAAVLLIASLLARGFDSNDDLARLIEHAKSASIDQQPHLCAEIARRELKSADELYTADKVDQAQAAVNALVAYSDQASEAAIRSGKHLKDTEIAMRKMADKLRDIKRRLTIDDQASVQSAADHLETLRTNLLKHMFKGKK